MKIVELVLDEDQENTGIEAISIVDNPAIEADFIALKSNQVILAEVSKDKRILMGALLIPNKPIYRMSEDGEYYIYFSKETVEKASQMYLKKGNQNNATLEHRDQLQGLTLVESWIIEDEVYDKSKKYGLNLPVGTWMGSVKVESDELWAELKKKGGFSIEGYFADKMQKLKTIKPEMKKDEKEAEILLSKIINIVKGKRVDLGLADDFEKKFNKTNDDDAKIGKQLIDNLRKAEVQYSQISKDYQNLIKQGEKLESSAKDLGVDLPVIIKNKILSSKEGVKEAQKLNQSITKMYSIF